MKKTFKIFRRILLILAGLAILTVIGFMLFFPVDKARQMVMEEGSAQLGRPVLIEDASVSFWGGIGVKLQQVSVGNPEGFEGDYLIKADNIDVKLNLWPLLSGEYSIDRLIVNRPTIVMVKKADGLNNFTFETAEENIPEEIKEKLAPEVIAAAAPVTFDELQINNGSIVYDNFSDDYKVLLQDITMSTSLVKTRDQVYESKGKVDIKTVMMSNSQRLPEFSIGSEYDLVFNVADQKLKVNQTKFALDQFEFELSGMVEDIFNDLKARGNIKAEQTSMVSLIKFLPESKKQMLDEFLIDGWMSMDVNADYGWTVDTTITYYGSVIFDKVNLKHRKYPGEFKFDEALLDVKNDNLRFSIKKGSFDERPFKGYLVVDKFDAPIVKGELAGAIDLAYLELFTGKEVDLKLKGLSEFELKLFGPVTDIEALDISGRLMVAGGELHTSLLPEAIESFDLDLFIDNDLAKVDLFKAQTASGLLTFEGRLNDVLQYMMADSNQIKNIIPTVDGNLRGEIDLYAFNSILPPQGNPQLSGKGELDLRLIGPMNDLEKLKPFGTVKIDNASYSDSLLPETINSLKAELVIAPDTIQVKQLQVQFESSDVSFSGNLIRPFPYFLPIKDLDRSQMSRPLFLFNLTSHKFDADRLFPEAVPDSEDLLGHERDSVSVVILPDIDGSGTFDVDTLIYYKVAFNDISGKVKIHDRKIECYDVNGQVYSGHVTGTTTIDLNDFKRPHYSGWVKAEQIEANDFVSRFTPYADHLFGKLDFEGNYSAFGWEPDEFLESLTLSSTSQMVRGKLVTSGVILSKMNSLADKLDRTFDKEQTIRDLKSKVKVKDGQIVLDEFSSRLTDWGVVNLSGALGFDKRISYDGTITLSKEISRKLTSNTIDRLKLPLEFGGTVEKPEFKIDLSDMAVGAGKNILKDLGDLFK